MRPTAIAPMLARLAAELPAGPGWLYEPKWDGFRAVVSVGDDVAVTSRNGRPLQRYFPEVVEALAPLPAGTVLDGEILLADPTQGFPALLERIHPAASRVTLLAGSRPAALVAFDLLMHAGEDLMPRPLAERRSALAALLRGADPRLHPTEATCDPRVAERWLDQPTAAWDGVVAKRLSSPYLPGAREWTKVKRTRTADCVVAGVRVDTALRPASLLLGVWTQTGTLHHPGVVSAPPRAVKDELQRRLPELAVPLAGHPWCEGFGVEGGATGRLKGAGGRWLPGMTQDWVPLAPVTVAEVRYDRLDGWRFRHPARWLRWRPDRDARSCGVDQLVAG
jgi:ATP-dependent DNA ligase